MMSSKYTVEAEDLKQLFLEKIEEAFADIVFSPNLHSLNHLAWQVRNFGPLWTCSSMMFESANYLLQSKFTGTVNILPLIVERYLRNKSSLKQDVHDDSLAELCHQLRNTRKAFRRVPLDISCIPFEYRNENEKYFSNAELTNFELDSTLNSSAINSFVSFVNNDVFHCGQIRFFIAGHPEKMLIDYFKIIESYQSEKKVDLPIYSFHQVEHTKHLGLVDLHCLVEKILCVNIDDKMYLVPLINMFEHD